MWSSRLLLMIMLGVGVVLIAFLAVLTGSWWGVAGAVTVLLAVTALVVRNVLSMLGDVDAPSATERARLEAQGVRDPDRELNERQTGRDGGQRAAPVHRGLGRRRLHR